MKQCEYCENHSSAVYLVTIKDIWNNTTIDDAIPLCEDHAEDASARVQMSNIMRPRDQYTIIAIRIKP